MISWLLHKLFHLQEGELGRLSPFFVLYLLLFAALTLADGLSVSLFVQDVGSGSLPLAYALIALLNFMLVGWYFFSAPTASSQGVFLVILGGMLLAFLGSWCIAHYLQVDPIAYGLLFIAREIALTMILLHFGTYLQDFFTREEMNRVLPIVYAGGRVGGIGGAALLQYLSEPVGLENLSLIVVGLGGVCLITVYSISSRESSLAAPSSQISRSPLSPEEERAQASLGGFLRYVWVSPLLFWLTATSVLFMISRWVLNYQYSKFFDDYWYDPDPDAIDMAVFLGRYTQIALAGSLVLQLFVVNRLITRFGLAGANQVYTLLVLAASILNLWPMTMTTAVFSRLVETELRFGLRNPIAQLITNKFSRAVRTRVRSWTMGVLTPVATIIASGLIALLVKNDLAQWLGWAGVVLGVVYQVTNYLMGRSLKE